MNIVIFFLFRLILLVFGSVFVDIRDGSVVVGFSARLIVVFMMRVERTLCHRNH